MGKAIRGVPEAPPLRGGDGSRADGAGGAGGGNTGSPGKDGIGSYLASQRKLRGISLEELARVTRIPRRSLERLEAGVFDDQPDGFVRGFVRTVAGAIGLDPDATVTRMLTEPLPRPVGRLPDPRRVGAVVGIFLGLVVLGLLLVRALPTGHDARPEPPPPRLVRHDAVRALAVSRGIVPPRPRTVPAAPDRH